jgi:hypothetical protein
LLGNIGETPRIGLQVKQQRRQRREMNTLEALIAKTRQAALVQPYAVEHADAKPAFAETALLERSAHGRHPLTAPSMMPPRIRR